jgi:hypothetical protein
MNTEERMVSTNGLDFWMDHGERRLLVMTAFKTVVKSQGSGRKDKEGKCYWHR